VITETWSLFGPLVAVKAVKEIEPVKPGRQSPWSRLVWRSSDATQDGDVPAAK
jgi:hypothetical protein